MVYQTEACVSENTGHKSKTRKKTSGIPLQTVLSECDVYSKLVATTCGIYIFHCVGVD